MDIKDQFNKFFNYTDLYCYHVDDLFYEFFVRDILPEYGFSHCQILLPHGSMGTTGVPKNDTAIHQTYKIKRVYNRDHVGILAYSFGKEMP